MHRLLVIAAAVALTACAEVSPVVPDAPPGAEGASCAVAACAADLTCVADTCVRTCFDAAACGGRACLPMPGSPTGWCALDGSGADEPAPPPPDPSAPGAQDPAAPAPDESPAPGERPPPKLPQDEPDAPPADEAPAPEAPAPEPPAEEPPAPEPPAAEPPADEPPAPEWPDEEPEQAPPPPQAEEPPPPEPCRYPGGFHQIQSGSVMPNLSWSGAYDAQGNRVDFSLEDFHCDPAYDRYSIIAVIVGAEWCGACSQYLSQNRGRMAGDDAAGALYLFVEVQDNSYSPASNEVARRIIDRHAPGAPGLRVGDGATRGGNFGNAPLVQQYPTIFAVRRSDMTVVSSLGGYMDFAALARQEAERAPPQGGPSPDPGPGAGPGPAPDPGPAPAGCEEEDLEPNDAPGSPSVLRPGDQVVGGVCNGSDDFFRVEHDGFWTLDLRFRHGDGDLDVYVWDQLRNAPAVGLDGRPVGSDSATDDEMIIFLGPQVIQVTGYQGARAPYVLTLMGH